MFRLLQYYNRYQGVRGAIGGMPAWARGIVFLFAIPGIALIALSIVVFCVSLLALLLLTVPVYSLLRTLLGEESLNAPASGDGSGGIVVDANTTVLDSGDDLPNRPRRQVDVRIVE